MNIDLKTVDELTVAFGAGMTKWLNDHSLELIEPIQYSNLPVTEHQPDPAILIWMAVKHIITGETKGVGVPIGKRFAKEIPIDASVLVKKVSDELTKAFWPEREKDDNQI